MSDNKKPAATRVYVVISKDNNLPIALIDAVNEPRARAHHSDKTVEVRYAEQADMFAAAKAGIDIEKAE